MVTIGDNGNIKHIVMSRMLWQDAIDEYNAHPTSSGFSVTRNALRPNAYSNDIHLFSFHVLPIKLREHTEMYSLQFARPTQTNIGPQFTSYIGNAELRLLTSTNDTRRTNTTCSQRVYTSRR
jgi:hypothetical protein